MTYDKLTKIKFMRYFKTITDVTEGILFGVRKVTRGAPHILDNLEIKRYMAVAIIALVPTAAASIYFFGVKAVLIIVLKRG